MVAIGLVGHGSRGRNLVRNLAARIDPAVALLLVLPLAVLLLYPDWIFNRWNYCDPWIYSGYFLDYPRHIHISDQGYFGTRLSVILPGYLIYRLFSPLTANAVLHLLLYEASVLALYALLRASVGRRTALLASILMGCHAFFLWQVGWDYVDSFGITYYLLTAWALSAAAQGLRRRPWLLAAGAFAAALVYANLFYVIYLPFLAGLYWLVRRDRSWGNLRAAALFLGLGGAALTVLLGVIHWCMGGRFWFYWLSIKWAYLALQHPNPYKAASYAWLTGATWLVWPAITAAGSLAYLLFRARTTQGDRRSALAHQLNFLGVFLMLVLLECRRMPVLQYYFECSLLIPMAFVALGAQLQTLVEHWPPRRFALVVGLAVLLSLAPFGVPLAARGLGRVWAGVAWPGAVGPAIGAQHPGGWEGVSRSYLLFPLLTGLAGLGLLLLRRPRLLTAGLVFLLLSLSNFAAAQVGFFEPLIKNIAPPLRASNADMLRAIARTLHAVQSMDRDGKISYWFDPNEPEFAAFHNVALAGLWLSDLGPGKFPFVRTGSCLHHVLPDYHDKVAILSGDPAAAVKVLGVLRDVGLDGRLLVQQPIHLRTVHYTLSFVEVLPRYTAAPASSQ